jgi:hypothetical protein
MFLERTNLVKGAIWPFGLDHPFIAIAERDVKEWFRRRVCHLGSLVQSRVAFCKARAKSARETSSEDRMWVNVAARKASLTDALTRVIIPRSMGHHDQVGQKERASFAASNVPAPITTTMNGS